MNRQALLAFQQQVAEARTEVSGIVEGFWSEWDTFRPLSDQLEAMIIALSGERALG